jgi:hypothetical protein
MKRYSEVLRELRQRMSEPSKPSPERVEELKAIRDRIRARIAKPEPKKEPA